MKMEFLVKGIVERTVSVEGNCIRDGIANAKKEWSALTGGDLTTAETAFEELENGDKPEETKQEVLTALTKLYYTCVNNGWSRMADAISTAEDVARQEDAS